MKKTLLKQLIDEMQDLKKTKIFNNSLKAIDECIDLAYAKLEMEKEQILDAYVEGCRKGFNSFGEDSEKFYKETYIQSSE